MYQKTHTGGIFTKHTSIIYYIIKNDSKVQMWHFSGHLQNIFVALFKWPSKHFYGMFEESI